MKKKLLLPIFALLSISGIAQSDIELLPYNPDFDGDGNIGAPDLLGFLPTYGETFQPEGVLPVEFGGTGGQGNFVPTPIQRPHRCGHGATRGNGHTPLATRVALGL